MYFNRKFFPYRFVLNKYVNKRNVLLHYVYIKKKKNLITFLIVAPSTY